MAGPSGSWCSRAAQIGSADSSPAVPVERLGVRGGRLPLGIADGVVYADGICVYVAKDMRVTLIRAGGA